MAAGEQEKFGETCQARWGDDMTCESMLEHAVVHPLRHSFQIEELMQAQPISRG